MRTTRPGRSRAALPAAVAGVLIALAMAAGPGARGAHAQAAPSTDTLAASADSLATPQGPTPAGAMLRSALIPGWGQGAVGSHVRGGVYYAGHLVNVFMLVKTRAKLGEIRTIAGRREAFVRDSVRQAEPDLPADTLALRQDAALENDARLGSFRALEDSREQQREDWLVWGGFWLLASAVDAYVAAQLQDFPAEVILQPAAGGGLELGLSLRGRR